MNDERSITTKVGDKGTTFLFSGEEVPKDSPRTEAYGDLDELVSVLGIARTSVKRPVTRSAILFIQRELFIVGTELATSLRHVRNIRERIDATRLGSLERRRLLLEKKIHMPRGFIIPGGTRGAAHLDHARTLARKLERKVIGIQRRGLVRNKSLTVWLNRLSDYLWLLARYEEGKATVLK